MERRESLTTRSQEALSPGGEETLSIEAQQEKFRSVSKVYSLMERLRPELLLQRTPDNQWRLFKKSFDLSLQSALLKFIKERGLEKLYSADELVLQKAFPAITIEQQSFDELSPNQEQEIRDQLREISGSDPDLLEKTIRLDGLKRYLRTLDQLDKLTEAGVPLAIETSRVVEAREFLGEQSDAETRRLAATAYHELFAITRAGLITIPGARRQAVNEASFIKNQIKHWPQKEEELRLAAKMGPGESIVEELQGSNLYFNYGVTDQDWFLLTQKDNPDRPERWIIYRPIVRPLHDFDLGREKIDFSIWSRTSKAAKSPEYQAANCGAESACVDMALRHALLELRPDSEWEYETIQAITGKEKEFGGIAPFRLLQELPRYGIEATYFTSLEPTQIQAQGLEHFVEVFGERARLTFSTGYNLEAIKKDSTGTEKYLQHRYLELGDLERFLQQNFKVITFIDARKPYRDLLALGLVRPPYRDPKNLIFHAIQVNGIDDKNIRLYDPAGLFPPEITKEHFLSIWTVGPKEARETLVLGEAKEKA